MFSDDHEQSDLNITSYKGFRNVNETRTAWADDGLDVTLLLSVMLAGHQYDGAKRKYHGWGTWPSVGST